MDAPTIIPSIAPAYAADTRIADFITIARMQTSATRFGDKYELAVALRVCHMIARNPTLQPGAPGAVSAASEGGVSQSYSIPPELQRKYGDLCGSPYGAQLAQLIEGNVIGVMVVGGLSGGISPRRGF